MPEFLNTFEEGATLDLKSTGLATSQGAVFRKLDNVLLENGYNLRGRRGVQIVGQHGGFIATHRYTYLDSETGETIEEIIAINDSLWVLTTEGVTLQRTTGSNPFDYEVMPDETGDWFFRIYEYPAGVKTLHYERNLGTGFEDAPYSIWELKIHLLANSDFELVHATVDGRILEGAITSDTQADTEDIQVTAATSDITVAKYCLGKWLPVYSGQRLKGVKIYDISTVGPNDILNVLKGGDLSDGFSKTFPYDLGLVVGPGATPAASIPIKNAPDTSANTTAMTFPVSHWEKRLCFGGDHSSADISNLNISDIPRTAFRHDNVGPFYFCWTSRHKKGWRPPTFENHKDLCFIAFSNDIRESEEEITGDPVVAAPGDFHVYMYDGIACYRAGLPQPFLTAGNTPGGNKTGTYRYKVIRQHIDARGNIHLSQPSNELTVTLSAQNYGLVIQNIAITAQSTGLFTPAGFSSNIITVTSVRDVKIGDWIRAFCTSGGEVFFITVQVIDVDATANTVTIDLDTTISDSVVLGFSLYIEPQHGFRTAPILPPYTTVGGLQYAATAWAPFVVGDTLAIRVGPSASSVPVTGSIVSKTARRKVESYTDIANGYLSWATQTEVTGDPVFTGGITANTTLLVYRTMANSDLFYFVCEVPEGGDAGGSTIIEDAHTDALLGELLIEPDFGESRLLPPMASVICSHQGVLVASGIRNEPNSVEFSSITQGPGAFSRETNQFDVPSTTGGTISVVASDRDDRLAVLKERAYFDVAGSLPSLNFTVRAVKDGDYGISSQTSVVKVDGTLVGVGPLGFVAVQDGQLMPVAEEIAAEIINNKNLALGRARAWLNFKERHYQCFIPGISCDCPIASRDADNDRMFVFDYSIPSQSSWRAYKFGEDAEPLGGAAMFRGAPYFLRAPNAIEGGTYNNRGYFVREIPERYIENGIGDNLPEVRDPHLFFIDHNQAIAYTMRSQWITVSEPNVPKTFKRMVIHSLYRFIESQKFVAWTATVNVYRNFYEVAPYATYQVSFNDLAEFQRVIPLRNVSANALMYEIIVEEMFKAPHVTGYTIVVEAPYNKEDVKR